MVKCKNAGSDQTALDAVLPEYEFRGIVSVRVHASPAAIFAALDAVTLADMPLAYALGTLRYVPGRLRGRGAGSAPLNQPFMQQLLTSGGNAVLAREPEREIVIGGIGKYHQMLDQEPLPFAGAEAFRVFDHPDYEKLAMSFRIVGGDEAGGCRLALEHRTHALSATARRKFRAYWLFIKPGGNFVSWLLLRAVKRRAERAPREQMVLTS